MKRKIEIGTAIFLMMACSILACLITYTFVTSKMTTVFATSDKYAKLSQVEQIVASRYVNEFTEDKAMNNILSAYVNSVDQYGQYMDAEAYQKYRDQSNGKNVGLGITVQYVSSTGYMKVVKVDRSSSTYEAGVKAGDIIYKIDGTEVSTMTEQKARDLLNGKVGSSTVLSIYRGEKTLEKQVLYSEYTSSTVSSRQSGEIGIIRFEGFDSNTAAEFDKAYDELKDDHIKALIFDVRNNDGGDLDAVCAVLDKILPKGVIVTTESKSGGKGESVMSDSSEILLPMCVLINNKTYGAAELFAADIRDYQKGTLVGVTTCGKAVAQQIIPLGDQTAVYLSTQKYYPASGKSFEDTGVAPNVTIKMSDADLEIFYELSDQQDQQLQKAISLLQ